VVVQTKVEMLEQILVAVVEDLVVILLLLVQADLV
jgi:hypothetical protein